MEAALMNPQDISALIARVEEAERLLSGSSDSVAFSAWCELNAALPLLKALHSQTEGGDDAGK